jgi:APA family basic amino acid/polyamine antiporter
MSDRKLKRTMGMWMATALVIGNMVGSGIFLLPASLSSAAGPVSIIGWVFTGIGAMLLALVFARLGAKFPRTGGPYGWRKRRDAEELTAALAAPPATEQRVEVLA